MTECKFEIGERYPVRCVELWRTRKGERTVVTIARHMETEVKVLYVHLQGDGNIEPSDYVQINGIYAIAIDNNEKLNKHVPSVWCSHSQITVYDKNGKVRADVRYN